MTPTNDRLGLLMWFSWHLFDVYIVPPPRRRASITEAKPDLKAISGTCVKVLTEELSFLENSGLHPYKTTFWIENHD